MIKMAKGKLAKLMERVIKIGKNKLYATYEKIKNTYDQDGERKVG